MTLKGQEKLNSFAYTYQNELSDDEIIKNKQFDMFIFFLKEFNYESLVCIKIPKCIYIQLAACKININ